MSFQAMTWAIAQDTKDTTTKLVLLCIANRASNDDWSCFPSLRTLAAETYLTERSVQQKVKHLIELGLLKVSRRRRPNGSDTSNLYRLIGKPVQTGPPQDGGERSSGGRVNVFRGEGGVNFTPLTSQVNRSDEPNTPLSPKSQNGEQTKVHSAPRFDPAAVPLPDDLDTKRFRAAWADWCQHRRETGKRLTPLAVQKQLTKCAGMGPERAVLAIENSIAGGWQGIFEPRQHGRGWGERQPVRDNYNDRDFDKEPIE